MFDPPHKGVAGTVALLQSGGVQVAMITGDAEETALSVARSLELRGATGAGVYLMGAALERMSAAQLCERVGNVNAFLRTSLKHKMVTVGAFGAVVAMTGDGGEYLLFFICLFYGSACRVPVLQLLKMADIGVSMGKSGTDVAREATGVLGRGV